MKNLQNIIKESKKNSKGITMVALAVTIIILIILAGVSITMITNEKSVMNKAKEGRQATYDAYVEQQIGIWRMKQSSYHSNDAEKRESLGRLLEGLGPEGQGLITDEEITQIIARELGS